MDATDDDGDDGEADDEAEADAAARLVQLIGQQRTTVFYSRQLEVLHENQLFHWITNRAMRKLEDDRFLRLERHELDNGGRITLCWHRSYRYPRRDAKEVLGLVNRYSNHAVGEVLGERGEQLVLQGFARNQFLL